jgi:hypothetical protein
LDLKYYTEVLCKLLAQEWGILAPFDNHIKDKTTLSLTSLWRGDFALKFMRAFLKETAPSDSGLRVLALGAND